MLKIMVNDKEKVNALESIVKSNLITLRSCAKQLQYYKDPVSPKLLNNQVMIIETILERIK